MSDRTSKSDDSPATGRGRTPPPEPAAAAEPAPDAPVPVPAAVAGAVADVAPGVSPPGQGAQVVLTGDAQAAARGGFGGDIHENTIARDAAIAAGHVVVGTTAEAAADATQIAPVDEIDEAEAAAIEKAHAEARDKRIARAAQKPA